MRVLLTFIRVNISNLSQSSGKITGSAFESNYFDSSNVQGVYWQGKSLTVQAILTPGPVGFPEGPVQTCVVYSPFKEHVFFITIKTSKIYKKCHRTRVK